MCFIFQERYFDAPERNSLCFFVGNAEWPYTFLKTKLFNVIYLSRTVFRRSREEFIVFK